MAEAEPKHKEIYTYEAPWPTYALSWCRGSSDEDQFRLAVGSFKEEYSNQVYRVYFASPQCPRYVIA